MNRIQASLMTLVLGAGFFTGCNDEIPTDPVNPPTAEITYGIEIEPDYKNHPRLALYYRPEGIRLENWVALSKTERVKRGYERCNVKDFDRADEWFPGIPAGVFPERVVEIEGMIKQMHCDAPGSTEVNGAIYSSLDDFSKFLTTFTEEMGYAGSQGHIVMPKQYFPGILGFTLYEGDRAIMRRAAQEYKVYEQDNTKIPGPNFRALALGLMGHNNWVYFKNNIERLKKGEDLIFQGTGHGKWNGPHIRQDVYPKGKMGFEIRQEDNPGTAPGPYKEGPERLIEAMKRADYLVRDLKRFETFVPFEETKIIDVEGYNKTTKPGAMSFLHVFKARAQQIAKTAPNGPIKVRAQALAKSIKDELERTDAQKQFNWNNWRAIKFKSNFVFPLRAWENYPVVAKSDSAQDLITNIRNHTLTYIEDVITILSKKNRGKRLGENADDQQKAALEAEEIMINHEFQIAASKWISAVDLFPAFQKFEDKNGIPNFIGKPIKYKYPDYLNN